MDAFANSLGLTLLYLALLGIGIIYAVIILIGGALHHVDLPGSDLDLGGGRDGAGGGGLVVAGIPHFALGYFLIAPQGSSEVKLKDIVGAVAEVITPIP